MLSEKVQVSTLYILGLNRKQKDGILYLFKQN